MATIFVVDDEEDITNILVQSFKDHGYDVIGFVCPEKMIRSLQVIKCSLIISDFKMPKVDGLQLMVELKDIIGNEHPPVVFFTGYLGKENYSSLLDRGAKAVFQKPQMYDEMIDFVSSNIFNKNYPN